MLLGNSSFGNLPLASPDEQLPPFYKTFSMTFSIKMIQALCKSPGLVFLAANRHVCLFSGIRIVMSENTAVPEADFATISLYCFCSVLCNLIDRLLILCNTS